MTYSLSWRRWNPFLMVVQLFMQADKQSMGVGFSYSVS